MWNGNCYDSGPGRHKTLTTNSFCWRPTCMLVAASISWLCSWPSTSFLVASLCSLLGDGLLQVQDHVLRSQSGSTAQLSSAQFRPPFNSFLLNSVWRKLTPQQQALFVVRTGWSVRHEQQLSWTCGIWSRLAGRLGLGSNPIICSMIQSAGLGHENDKQMKAK